MGSKRDYDYYEAHIPLLVNASQRQVASEMLERALSDGYITVSDFEERTFEVWDAKNLGDLWAATINVPEVDDNVFFQHEPNNLVKPWYKHTSILILLASLVVIGLALLL